MKTVYNRIKKGWRSPLCILGLAKRQSRVVHYALCMTTAFALSGCESGEPKFDDFEGGTTVYFPYQYPVRTIVLGDDEYDTTLDKQHQCQLRATFGGSYNGSNGSVQIAVDETLCQNLTFADGTPVKAMPAGYYQLLTTSLNFDGSFYGIAGVQLTDAFFADPDAIKNTYVIPVVMTSQTGFGRILTGSLKEGGQPVRTDASQWDTLPMDYMLYCVKFQNRYTGWWLTNGTMSTENIEKANTVHVTTRSLDEAVYTVTWQDGADLYTADLLLSFTGDQCTISSLTDGVTASGSGTFGDNTEKNAWGGKDRDSMELNYTVSFADGHSWSTHEKLVWQRSGVASEEFAPIYVK